MEPSTIPRQSLHLLHIQPHDPDHPTHQHIQIRSTQPPSFYHALAISTSPEPLQIVESPIRPSPLHELPPEHPQIIPAITISSFSMANTWSYQKYLRSPPPLSLPQALPISKASLIGLSPSSALSLSGIIGIISHRKNILHPSIPPLATSHHYHKCSVQHQAFPSQGLFDVAIFHRSFLYLLHYSL
jgi:hypothetical protein